MDTQPLLLPESTEEVLNKLNHSVSFNSQSNLKNQAFSSSHSMNHQQSSTFGYQTTNNLSSASQSVPSSSLDLQAQLSYELVELSNRLNKELIRFNQLQTSVSQQLPYIEQQFKPASCPDHIVHSSAQDQDFSASFQGKLIVPRPERKLSTSSFRSFDSENHVGDQKMENFSQI